MAEPEENLIWTHRRARRSPLLAVSAACLWVALFGTVRAQIGAIGGPTGPPQLQAPPLPSSGGANVFAPPERTEQALPLGTWLFYPNAFAGAAYDTNPGQRTTGAGAGAGLQLVPSFLAERYNGISRTSLYGTVDGRIYTNSGTSNANTLSAQLGGIEDYQPLPDWLFHAQGDYTLQRNLFGTFGITHGVTTLNPTGVGLSPTANAATYNQFSGIAAAQKNFANAFFGLGGSVVDIIHNTSSGVPSSPNGIVYTGTGRGGIWFAPDFYGYLEVSGDIRNYATGALSSSGYRTVGGIGSNQIGLFRGQIYGGYQAEGYNSAAIGTVSAPVYGGQVYYYPLPELTLSLAADRLIGVSSLVSTSSSPVGTATTVTDILALANYALAPEWSASGRGGFIQTSYGGSIRRDDAWTVGTTLTYSIWRRFGLTLDYQHLILNSNVPLAGFSEDVITAGLTYKY